MIYTQIRAFDAVAREGSFSRAAEMLGVTQPALTIQVKALEERYGVKLLLRQGRSVQLTELGARLFQMSRRLAGLEEQIRETLAASQDLEQGSCALRSTGRTSSWASSPASSPAIRGRAVGRARQQPLRAPGAARPPGRHRNPSRGRGPPADPRSAALAPSRRRHRRPPPSLGRADGDRPRRARRPADGRPRGGLDDPAPRRRGARQGRRHRAARPRARQPRGAVRGGRRGARHRHRLGAGGARRPRLVTIPIAGDGIHSTDYVACLKSEWMRRSIKAFFQVALSLPGAGSDIAALRAAM